MVIHVALGDIAQLPSEIDAIVNPTNSLGVMVASVALTIKEAGGQSIEDEAKACAPIAVGAAIVTSGGRLFTKHVIHVPTMEEPGMKIGVENVRRATRAALIAAARHGFNVIAMPGMGTGTGGVAMDEAARAMVDELRAHKQPQPSTIYLVALTDEMVTAFAEALRNATTII